MANVITQDDLGKSNLGNKNPQQGIGQTNAPGTPTSQPGGSPGGTGAPQGAGGPGGAPLTPTQRQGSGFTNVNRIMAANQGNRLGSTIGSGIQQQGQQVQQQLGQAQQQFQQDAQQNRLDTQANQQLIQQGLQDPTKMNQQQISQFQNILSGKYQGPTGLQNADQLQAQAQTAQQMGQALGSQGGRQGLLQRFVGGNQYGQGQQTLDAMLLGAGPQQALNQARQSVGGLGTKVQSGEQAAEGLAQQLGARAQQIGQGAQQQLGQTVNQQVQSLQQQAQMAQTAKDKQYQDLISGLKSGNISAEDAAKLGLTSGEQVYNVFQDPGSLVRESAIKANMQNVASAQDYARMQALQQLAGSYAPSQAAQQLGQFAGQQGQAGAFQAAGSYEADPNQIQKAIQDQAKAYQDTMSNLTQRQNDLYNLRQQVGQGTVLGPPSASVTPTPFTPGAAGNPMFASAPNALQNPQIAALQKLSQNPLMAGYQGDVGGGFGGNLSTFLGNKMSDVQKQMQQTQAGSGYGNVMNISGQTPVNAPTLDPQLQAYLAAAKPWDVQA